MSSSVIHSPSASAHEQIVPPQVFDRLLFTGDEYFLRRFRYLTAALTPYAKVAESFATPPLYRSKLVRRAMQFLFRLRYGNSRDPATFYKNAGTFVARSRMIERQVRAMAVRPDHVFHVFGMCVPSWDHDDMPFSMILDFTMDMCRRLYPPWSIPDTQAWCAAEKRGYQRASHIFTAGSDVKASLVNCYGVDPARVTVTGLPGVFPHVFEGTRTYGSRTMLFYNLEFQRKGGDLVLESFKKVHAEMPDARLIVIGEQDHIPDLPGVENRGWQTLEQLQELFLTTDLIVAPARCEPFGQFMVEAMNYGIPCVATVREGNGIADFISHNVDGLLVADASPAALAQMTLSLLRDPQRLQQLGTQAREKVRRTLTSDVVAATIIHHIQHHRR